MSDEILFTCDFTWFIIHLHHILHHNKMNDQIYADLKAYESSKEMLFHLAKDNRINVFQQRLDKSFTVIAPSTSIVNGSLYLNNSCNWRLAVHELCHILSVEPEYRHLLDGCTHKSYTKINKKYGFSKLRTESATIGLNDILNKELDLHLSVSSSFWSGKIGNGSDVCDEWISLGHQIKDRIVNTYQGFTKSFHLDDKCPRGIEDDTVVAVSNHYITKLTRVSGNKLIDKSNHPVNQHQYNKFAYFA